MIPSPLLRLTAHRHLSRQLSRQLSDSPHRSEFSLTLYVIYLEQSPVAFSPIDRNQAATAVPYGSGRCLAFWFNVLYYYLFVFLFVFLCLFR